MLAASGLRMLSFMQSGGFSSRPLPVMPSRLALLGANLATKQQLGRLHSAGHFYGGVKSHSCYGAFSVLVQDNSTMAMQGVKIASERLPQKL